VDDLGEVFPAVLEELADPHRPTVLAVEDVHWADSATLDLLRHVGRRVDDLPALLVLTYRPDVVGRVHPLLGVCGSLGGRVVRRVALVRSPRTRSRSSRTAHRSTRSGDRRRLAGGRGGVGADRRPVRAGFGAAGLGCP